ncbi:MAG: hypothetical protein WBA17_04220 [Saprospiraceae bacterium]
MYLLLLLFGLFVSAPAVDAPPAPAPPPSLYLSTDLGVSWNAFTDGLPPDAQTREVMEHRGDLYLGTFKHGIYVLPAGECAWQSRSTGFPVNLSINTFIGIGNRILAATYNGGIYLSDDKGAHWRRPIFNVNQDWTDPLLFHNGILYGGTDGGIWSSADRGDSWQLLSEERVPIYGLALHNDQIFVARQNGMGILKEKQIIWADISTETAIGPLLSVKNYLYAKTAGGEVIRTKNGNKWERITLDPADPSAFIDSSMSLWNVQPKLPGDLPAGAVTETSRGWVVGLFNGC